MSNAKHIRYNYKNKYWKHNKVLNTWVFELTLYDNINFCTILQDVNCCPYLHFWVKMSILNMSYWVESCKIWFVWLILMPGALFTWSAVVWLEHMLEHMSLFRLMMDKVYWGDWLWAGLSFNHQSYIINPSVMTA